MSTGPWMQPEHRPIDKYFCAQLVPFGYYIWLLKPDRTALPRSKDLVDLIVLALCQTPAVVWMRNTPCNIGHLYVAWVAAQGRYGLAGGGLWAFKTSYLSHCFVLAIQDVSSQLPALATVHLPSATMIYTDHNHSPVNPSFCKLLLVLVSHHSKKESLT